MPLAKSTLNEANPVYAIAGDFCRIFAEDMKGLYLLSFLLTADSEKAEKCFVSGLGDCIEANSVFADWARSWARRTVVQNAIRTIEPTPLYSGERTHFHRANRVVVAHDDVPLSAVLSLPTFDRFVFVMSALERYSDQECKALLRCSQQDIVAARERALTSIGAYAERTAPLAPFDAREFAGTDASLAKTA